MSGPRPVAYTIQRQGLRLDIALVETENLLLHEETIPEALEVLQEKIEDDDMLRSPVIADGGSLVVLDGMHRVKALMNLGCRFTCVCMVDYQSPEIVLDRWCRIVPTDLRIADFLGMIKRLGLRVFSLDRKREDTGILLLLQHKTLVLSAYKPGVKQAFKAVADLELRLRERGIEVGHETESDARERLEKGEVGAVICPPRIDKSQVLEVARRGEVFSFKATRHIVPARPVGVDVPLSLLRDEELTLEEANQRLKELLEGKVLRRIPPGSLRGGRRYEEELYVFEGT